MTRHALDIETIPVGVFSSRDDGVGGDTQAEILIQGRSADEDEVKRLSLDPLSGRIVALALVSFDQRSQFESGVVYYGDK